MRSVLVRSRWGHVIPTFAEASNVRFDSAVVLRVRGFYSWQAAGGQFETEVSHLNKQLGILRVRAVDDEQKEFLVLLDDDVVLRD
jgi:hypothetical protein